MRLHIMDNLVKKTINWFLSNLADAKYGMLRGTPRHMGFEKDGHSKLSKKPEQERAKDVPNARGMMVCVRSGRTGTMGAWILALFVEEQDPRSLF
jgi:hypothetical protein